MVESGFSAPARFAKFSKTFAEALKQVEVRARVSGTLDKINFIDGQLVKEGDLLFVIDPRPYQIAVDSAKAEVTRNIITTERQGINWEEETAGRLLNWGQRRLKELLALWQQRRAESKMRTVEAKLANFSRRIRRLKSSEAHIVKRALLRIGSIAAIDQSQFEDLAGAILTAWEGGRLRDIIDQVAHMETMDADMLVSVLAEHQVPSALHVAEAIKLKLDVVDGLRRRIAGRELENDIRDYITANTWLISPEWETFQIERRIGLLVEDALAESSRAYSFSESCQARYSKSQCDRRQLFESKATWRSLIGGSATLRGAGEG
jgi:hypothetical protein